MGLLTNLFRLIPPSFKAGYCPKTVQQLANDLMSGTQVTFLIQQGNFLYNMGSVTPAPENRIFPWLFTPNGRWYTFQFGLWVAPMDASSREPTFRKMWKPATGTPESALWSVDEGDGTDPSTTPPTPITGATWEVDHDMDGVFPMGVGQIPGTGTDPVTNPVVSIALGQTGGDYRHFLTELEGAVGMHTHLLGAFSAVGVELATAASQTVPSYTGKFVGDNAAPASYTTASLTTFPSGPSAAGVPTPDPFQILPPYRAIYWAKPTARQWYTLPA